MTGRKQFPVHLLPWCSGTAWDHQWTGTHTDLCAGSLSEGFWSNPGTDHCCWVETLQLAPGPGSTGTAGLGSVGSLRNGCGKQTCDHAFYLHAELVCVTAKVVTFVILQLVSTVLSKPKHEIFILLYCKDHSKALSTFLRLSPCEMLSAVRKAETRWVSDPVSPQWGRNWKVFSPRSLYRTQK